MSIKEKIQRNLLLLPGWRTKRKIVVIESDDWGAVRTPDKSILLALKKSNPLIEKDLMTQLDSIESNDDLSALFEVLQSVKDKNNHPAVITANTIVANPDFDRIAETGFNYYHFEKFTNTLNSYSGRDKVMQLIHEGIAKNIYQPQFHGREHLNVRQWMNALQSENILLLEAFQYKTYSIPINSKISKRNNLMSAFDYEDMSEKLELNKIVSEGMMIFEEIFGFLSDSFIATTYVWDSSLEQELFQQGIKFIQGIPFQHIPSPGDNWYKKKFHYTGQKNKLGQTYIVRNASFEPYMAKDSDEVGECMQRIGMAFSWGKPAIISSHRVNYIGSLDEKNRSVNLLLLKQLLNKIVKRWPDVEFMSSDKLGNLISNNIES